MRQGLLIAAMAAAVFLHVYTWNKASARRSPIGHAEAVGEISGPVLELADISASMQGDRITIVGRLIDSWEPTGKRAPHTLILRDGSGVLEIVHWLKKPPAVDVGDSVECTGTVDCYRGVLQLRLWYPGDLRILSP